MKKSLLFFALVLASYGTIQAQVTTSSMTGVVTQSSGHATVGATIKAVHVPSGTTYSGSANVAGRFNLANMRVGGPYRVEVTFVGQDPVVYEDLYLQLGQPFVINPVFDDATTSLEAVSVSGRRSELKTGSVTTVNRAQIENLPSISRSVNDLTRLTPQANGTSIGGGNYRANNFTVDGANFNNQFGIGQNIPANGSPISLDALEQIAVSVTPYDVRQSGFTGAAINAVTRSGTNEFSGTAFYTWRNEGMQGNYVGDYRVNKSPLDNKQFGFSLGGPIIKDKLFFFANIESNPVTEPGQNRVAATEENPFGSGSDVVRPTAKFLDEVRGHLMNKYGYDPGDYQGYSFKSSNVKIFGRIDWNINDNHKLNIRYNQVESKSPSFLSTSVSGSGLPNYSGANNRRSTNALHFSNSNYYQENNLYSGTLELNSKFGEFNNSFRASYVNQNEPRSSDGGLFPLVDIKDGPSILTSFGYDPFTYGNIRDVETYTLNNDVSYVVNRHSFTAGIQAEFSKVKNGFQRFGTGFYTFDSWDDFVNDRKPSHYALTYPMTPDGSQAFPSFKFAQYSLYLQDEFSVNDRLKLTGGLRLELPTFPGVDEIQTHPLVAQNVYNNGEKVDTGNLPSSKLMFSPRVSFNWDAMGDRSLVLRGGTGVFTGRVPFVWIVAQSGDAGMLQYTDNFEGKELPNFSPDITANYPSTLPEPGTSIPGNISALAKNFRFPQTWKTSLAVDYRLPWGIDATVEAIYNKDINAAYAKNVNMVDPTPRNAGYGDTRMIYPSSRNINGSHAAIVMANKKGGHYWSTTMQLVKNFDYGLSAMLAYTHSQAKNFGDGAGDQIMNLWSIPYNNTGNPNIPSLSYTTNVVPNRIIANVSYRQEWLSSLATTISLFYEGSIQGRYSYAYTTDFNNDGQNNDLLYIPKDKSEMFFVDIPDKTSGYSRAYTALEQAELFDELISNDKYLNSRRGMYTERNGAQLPWRSQFDLKITQEIFKDFGGKRNSLSVFWDVFNVGNLLNKKWGHYSYAMASGGLLKPVNMKDVVADPSIKPTYQLNAANGDIIKETTGTTQTISSTYYMQFGIRYKFN